jgi:iron complex outermembrane receptor protein
MRNEQVGITIDGMQVFGACTDRMDPITSYVETNNLEEVNTSSCGENKGCHSANIAGGLDLKLKDPYFGGGWGGIFGGGYVTNGNGYNGLLNLNYGNEKFAANINSVYRKQGNYTDGNGKQVLYSQYEKINLAANFRYRVAPNHVLRLSLIADDAFNIGYAALPMDVAFAKARLAGLTSTWYLNGFFAEINAKAYYNFVDHAMDDSQRPDVPIRMDMPGTSHTLGGFVEGSSKMIGKHKFYAKAEAFSNDRHAEMTMYPPNTNEPPMFMLTWPDVRKTSALAYVKDHYMPTENQSITLSASLQADFNQIISEEGESYLKPFGYTGPSTYILPAIEAVYELKITKQHSINASAGYASRGPGTSEQYAFYLFNAYDGYDYIGNPNILAEEALKARLGYTYSVKSWQIGIGGYGYRINNYILGITDSTFDAMTIGANGVRVYNNIDYATIYGADLTLTGNITGWLQLMAKTSYTRGILASGQNAPLIPPLNGVVSFKVKKGTWQGLFETEFATTQNLVNLNYGDAQTPGYVVNNLRILKAFGLKKTVLNVEAGVDNLFDVAYRNHLDWGGILRPGATFYAQVKLGF